MTSVCARLHVELRWADLQDGVRSSTWSGHGRTSRAACRTIS